MLGGDPVGFCRHLILVSAQDNLAIVAPSNSGNIGGRQHAELPVDFGHRGLRELRRGCQQYRRRCWAVLGLAKRSVAQISASAVSSAITRISVGPAKRSMPTFP